jgi:hypothetical protein
MIVINLYGGPGSGKCVKKGTKILKYDGTFIPVEQINKNDLLMGPNSTPRKIINMFYGKERLYKIELEKNIIIETTGNHILTLKSSNLKNNKIINISVKDFINKSEKFKKRHKMFSEKIKFNHQDILIDPYYLGIWLGDGHSAEYNTITNSDDKIVNFLQTFSKNLPEDSELKKVGNSKYTYRISRKNKKGEPEMLRYFRYYSLINNKHIPSQYLINDEGVRLNLLAGIIDSDGYLNKGNRSYEIITKFKFLSEDIKYLCQSLGFKVKITNKYNKQYNKNYYRIIIFGNEINKIPVLLDRKMIQSNKSRINYSLFKICNIIQNDHGNEYYGFELDGDNLFIIDDFIVTHNSTTAASLFSMLKMTGINCELVTEFAKDLTWDESSRVLGYQPYVFGQQAWRLERLSGKVDMVITDSPLILSTVYCDPALPQSWHDYVLWEHNRHSSMNFFIKRSNNYVQVGRNQSLVEAEKIDALILNKLNDLNINVTEFLSGDGTAPIKAYAKIMSETNIIKKAN